MEKPQTESQFDTFRPDILYLRKLQILSVFASLTLSLPFLFSYFIVESLLVFLSIPVILSVLLIATRLYYSAFKYQISNTEIVINLGIIFKKEVLIPLRTITNIDLFRGPVDRLFGLATVNIQTAGRASLLAEGRFIGLLNDDAIALVSLLRGKLQSMQGGDGTTMETTTTSGVGSSAGVDAVLSELRAIKQVLIDIRDANAKR